MKVNLRKASALQMAIQEQIHNAVLTTTIEIKRYDEPVKAVETAATKFHAALQKKGDLLGVLYGIRAKVATAGEKAGVSSLLADMALVDKQIALISSLAAVTDFALEPEKLLAAQEDLKKETTQTASYPLRKRESFSVSILPEDLVETFKKDLANLKKHKQSLSDKLLEVNVKTEIDLTEDKEILAKYDLV